MAVYIQNIGITQYGPSGTPTGSIAVINTDPHMNSTLSLDKEDVQAFHALAIAIFNKRRETFAQQIAGTVLAPPAITYDSSKTIDADDGIPF
jgi:hypothetical protein